MYLAQSHKGTKKGQPDWSSRHQPVIPTPRNPNTHLVMLNLFQHNASPKFVILKQVQDDEEWESRAGKSKPPQILPIDLRWGSGSRNG